MEIPAGFAQVNWKFEGTGFPNGAEVTLGVFAGGEDDPVVIAEAARDAWVSGMIPVQSSAITLVGVLVKIGPNSTGPSGEASASEDGDIGGDAMPPNVAILVKKNTNMGGRSGRGRMYIPGLAESWGTTGGVMSNTDLGNVQDAVTATMASLALSGYFPVVLHTAGAPLSEPTAVTSFVVQQRLATQRRRLRS